MEWLGEQENTYFIGQAVEVPGTAMFNTLKDISPKRLEVPVFEDTQMGMSIGMALTGKKLSVSSQDGISSYVLLIN